MPQMSPMWWTTLMILLFVVLMVIMYFEFKKLIHFKASLNYKK